MILRTPKDRTYRPLALSAMLRSMQLRDLQIIGTELAIRWMDGGESFITLETLRRYCPCAGCMGEQDIFGTTYKAPDRPYTPHAFKLASARLVGTYAWQPSWADGHATGLYTWEYLHRLAQSPSAKGEPHP